MAMTLGGMGKIASWIKSVAAAAKRIAELDARVSALEQALETAPADACPYCGERAMRLDSQDLTVKGNPGKQWTEETWRCEKCGQDYVEHISIGAR